jgi:hypothetical protein
VELTVLSTFGYSGCLQGRLVCDSSVDKSFVLRLGLAELQNSRAETTVFAYTDTEIGDENNNFDLFELRTSDATRCLPYGYE